jgi:hypothetical protein
MFVKVWTRDDDGKAFTEEILVARRENDLKIIYIKFLYYFFAQKSRSIAIPFTLRFDFLRGLAFACFLLMVGI